MWQILLPVHLEKPLEKTGSGKHDSISCLENSGSVSKVSDPDPSTLFIFFKDFEAA
jgi:hypothetical protein